MVTGDQIKQWIEAGLPGSMVLADGDGQHFEAVVVAEEFEGMNSLERHRLVYRALGDRMKADIHALSLKTLTPSEYENKK